MGIIGFEKIMQASLDNLAPLEAHWLGVVYFITSHYSIFFNHSVVVWLENRALWLTK